MAIFDNSKYDIELNGVGHRISGYKKSEANAFIPRLGSGDQSESDFDLLRTKSIVDFSAGQFQRTFESGNQGAFAIENGYPLYDDGALLPVKPFAAASTLMTGNSHIIAKFQTRTSLWIFYYDYVSSTRKFIRVDAGTPGTAVSITVPAKMLTWLRCTMAVYNGELWLTGTDGNTNATMYWMVLNATTMTEVTTTPTMFGQIVVYKGSLYGTDGFSITGNVENSSLFRYTGDKATGGFALVGGVTNKLPDDGARLFVFNNRIMLARSDGLWTYDTVTFSAVDDLTLYAHPHNYRCAVVLKGYIYAWMPDGMYRISAAGSIEKLYDTGVTGLPIDAVANDGRLWIIYDVSGYVGYGSGVNEKYKGISMFDNASGYNYAGTNNRHARIDVFNGLATYTWGRTAVQTGAPGFGLQNVADAVIQFDGICYGFLYGSANASYYTSATLLPQITGTLGAIKIITPIFDGDFSQLTKAYERLEFLFNSDISQLITLEYRTTGFEGVSGAGAWTALGTLTCYEAVTNTYRYSRSVWESIPAGVQFRQIQFRITTQNFTVAGTTLQKLIIGFSLMPALKYQWQYTVEAFGDSPGLEPLMLRDGTESAQTVQSLRGNIYAVRDSKVPVLFTDVDRLDLNTALTNSATSVVLFDTSLLKSKGFVKIEDEIIAYTAKTATTLQNCVRGQLGTSAVTHVTGSAVFPLYRVLVRQILNERIELADRDSDNTSGLALLSEITIMMQEV